MVPYTINHDDEHSRDSGLYRLPDDGLWRSEIPSDQKLYC